MKKLFLALALVSSQVFAGPFGLDKGMTLDEVKKHGSFVAVPGSPFTYKANALKQGHKDFDSYTVIVTPVSGLCAISASTEIKYVDAYGEAVRQQFDSLYDAISKKYGIASVRNDFVKAGSVWSEPTYWMMALAKHERKLNANWSSSRLTNDALSDISLHAHGMLNGRMSASILQYRFKNIDSCAKEANATNNANL